MRLAGITSSGAIYGIVGVAFLSGCGMPGTAGTAGFTPRYVPQARPHGIRSWMLPQARLAKSTLIYAADDANYVVYVYDYATGKQVGTLGGINSLGGCVDAKGDVYITETDGMAVEYAHGGTKPIHTYAPKFNELLGCSVNTKGDLAITNFYPGNVTVYAGGNPNKGTTYYDSACFDQWPMGYDNKGNLIGVGRHTAVSVCALLSGSKSETTLTTSGITINDPGGAMWDGRYITLNDQEANGDQDGIIRATLSGSTLTSQGETLLTDTCDGNAADVVSPFIVGTKNTPVNDRQGTVVLGANLDCYITGKDTGIQAWRYTKGGNPVKLYKTAAEDVIAVSVGTGGRTQTLPDSNAVGLVYVANFGSNDVGAYQAEAHGKLQKITGSPFASGAGPDAVVIDPTGRFAYVPNWKDGTISAYTISAAGGALSPIGGSPFKAGIKPGALAIDPADKFAFVANYGSNDISAYAINATSGGLKKVPGSPFSAGNTPYGAAIDPSGKHLYVPNNNSESISGYSIESSGKLKPLSGSPFKTGAGPAGIAIDPSGKYAYVPDSLDDAVDAFTIGTDGALTEVAGSPFPADSDPQNPVVTPDGRFLYVANFDSNNISAYRIDASSGALNAITGSPFDTAIGPISTAIDSSGTFAYVVTWFGERAATYHINAADGALRPAKAYPRYTGVNPWGVSTCRLSGSHCISPPRYQEAIVAP